MDALRFAGFDILKAMPKGAMGRVYQARQISLERIVALKMLPPEFVAGSADIEQFLSEARITANLKHQNIVQVYDLEKSEDGIYFFVMEFVSGYSVAEWIKRKGHLSEENSLLTAECVADALGYAWDKAGVVHCDVKPANVIIDGDGTVKVADLGLAKSVRSFIDKTKTAAGLVFGTPNYISPEQSRGDVDLDCRADIYSLGAMLYHCMTGKMPFEGLAPVEVMDRQITDQIPDPQDFNYHISAESACLIEKMMAKDREHRQKDWTAVSKDISRVMKQRMPLGDLPAPGTSTICRSSLRGSHPRPEVSVAPHEPKAVSTDEADSSAFRKMERKFEERKKLKMWSRPEWWFACALTIAVLFLGFLMSKSVLTRRGQPPSEAEIKRDAEVSKPEGTARKTAVSDEIGMEKSAKVMFDFAKKWVETHPAQYDEAIRNFEKVASETKGTKYSLMASAEIKKIKDSKRKAGEGVMAQLWDQAKALAGKNKFIGAAELYEKYKGRLAGDTASARKLKAKEWRDRDRAFKEKQRVAKQQLVKLIKEVASDLVNGDTEAALIRVKNVGSGTPLALKRNELKGLEALLSKASKTEQRILNSFRADQGQEITVLLAKGSETLLIGEVQDNHVKAERKIVIGEKGHVSRPKTIRVSDLALAEKQRRLGSDDLPEVALMQGLLMVREGDFGAAASFFAKTGPLLADPLVAGLNDKTNLQMEVRARETLFTLMRRMQIDIPEELPSCEVCLDAITKRSFSLKDEQVVTKAVEIYLSKYGHTKFAKEYEPVLVRLSDLSLALPSQDKEVVPEKISDEAPRVTDEATPDAGSITSRLIARNPGLFEKHIKLTSDWSGKIVGIAVISPDLKDIQPLSSLPDLREVVCSAMLPSMWIQTPVIAPLDDISPLKGLPVQALNISFTMVEDISALVNMPLDKLNLSYTKVKDIHSLQGMTLTELDISNLNIQDIRPLKGMPLEQLNISSTDITDLTPLIGINLFYLQARDASIRDISVLHGMPLKVLDLFNTDISDISMLRGLPLEQLTIDKTRVRDITPLSGMPLVRLSMNGTRVKDLSGLRGMPLKSLSIDDNNIFDLSPLAGMSLYRLSINGTAVKDLSVLRGMPKLRELNIKSTRVKDLIHLTGMRIERLNIGHTNIRDLSPLRGMPLKLLILNQTKVNDLTPIQNLPIEEIWLDFGPRHSNKETNRDFAPVLRKMPRLRRVNGIPFGGRRKRW